MNPSLFCRFYLQCTLTLKGKENYKDLSTVYPTLLLHLSPIIQSHLQSHFPNMYWQKMPGLTCNRLTNHICKHMKQQFHWCYTNIYDITLSQANLVCSLFFI